MSPPLPLVAAVPYGPSPPPSNCVVGIPATEAEVVVDGCVMADSREAAVVFIQAKLRPATTFRAGSQQYVVQTKLAEGPSSVLFQVEDTKTGRYAALKLVSLRQAHVGEVYDTAALLRRLHHEHILPCHDFFEYTDGSFPFLGLKMPFCARGSLGDLIRHNSRLGCTISARRVWGYISQLAAALQYLHQQGLLHGDLRPDHVLLYLIEKDAQLIGLTASVGLRPRSAGPVTVTGGRRLYVPPEWADSHFLGRRLQPGEVPLPSYDMWTLGCLLVELCTGRSLEARLGGLGALPLALDAVALEAVHAEMQSVHGGVFEPLGRGLLDPDPDARLTPEGVLRVLREIKTKKSSLSGALSKLHVLRSSTHK